MQIPALKHPPQPWYREPWPWLLMAGPAAVLVAGAITTTMAFRSADGLVADDYYKQGLAINRTLAREQRAAELRLVADLSSSGGRIRVVLSGAAPASVTLRLAHPTRAGFDQVTTLAPVAPGIYEGALRPVESGRWRVALETPEWRLAGEWHGGALRLNGAGA